MTYAEMAAVCKEAHRLGLHVAAHTAGGPPIEEALTAGVDTIEHGHWLTDHAIELMLERDASYVPTLIVNSRNFAYDRETLGASERSWRWLQGGLRREMGQPGASPPCWRDDRRRQRCRVPRGPWRECLRAGRVGQGRANAERSHPGGHGRGRQADWIGQDEIGTLEAGKLADVIVVEGRPAGRHHGPAAAGPHHPRFQGRAGSQGSRLPVGAHPWPTGRRRVLATSPLRAHRREFG